MRQLSIGQLENEGRRVSYGTPESIQKARNRLDRQMSIQGIHKTVGELGGLEGQVQFGAWAGVWVERHVCRGVQIQRQRQIPMQLRVQKRVSLWAFFLVYQLVSVRWLTWTFSPSAAVAARSSHTC